MAGAPRCLVIGTSNTLRRGGFPSYMRSLAPGLELSVTGVGATPSVLLPYVLAETSLDGVTHAVVDCFVNDSGLIARQGGEAAACDAILFDALDWLLGQGIRPILLLPRANAGSIAEAARASRLAFCAARGIPVVDGVALVEVLARRHGLGADLAFDDPQHVAWPISLMVARRLVEVIGGAAPPPPKPEPLPFFRRPLPPPPGATGLERATSLVPATRYLRLEAGPASEVLLEAEATLLGVSWNAAQGAGVLEITAEGGVAREARKDDADTPAPPRREMIHVVQPLATPLRGRRFRFTLGAEGGAGAFIEVEAAVFRHGSLPPGGEADGATPGGEPALTPWDVALAQAAVAAADQGGSGAGRQEGLERQFRRLVAGDPPAWSRHPANVARFLAQLGIALGDDRAARRLLQQAVEAYPDAEELRADLARLQRRMQGP